MKHLFDILILLVFVSGGRTQSTSWKQVTGPYSGGIIQAESTPDGGIFALGPTSMFYWDVATLHWSAMPLPFPDYTTNGEFCARIAIEPSGALLCYHIFPYHQFFGNQGIYRSSDRGKTWSCLYKYEATKPYFVNIVPTRSGTLYGFTASTVPFPLTTTQIYRSLDHGATWEFLTSINLPSRQQLADDSGHCYFPVDQETLGVVAYTTQTNVFKALVPATAIEDSNCRIILHHGTLYARSNHALYQIAPNGSWQLQSVLAAASKLPTTSLYSGSGKYLFTTAAAANGEYVLLASNSLGRTWDTVQLPDAGLRPSHLCFDSNGVCFLASGYNPSMLPHGIAGIHRSTDPLHNWKAFGISAATYSVLSEGPNGLLNAEAFASGAGTDWGFEKAQYCSLDSGRTWTTTQLQFPTLGHNPNDSLQSLAGTFFKDPDDGYYYISQGKTTHSEYRSTVSFADEEHPFDLQLQTSLISQSVSPVGCSSEHTFYATLDKGIYKTTDHGISWDELPMPNTATPLSTIAANLAGTLYAGYGPSIYRTSNDGVSWEKLSTGIKDVRITTIRFTGIATIVAGTFGNGIWRSLDNGVSWQQWGAAGDSVYGMEASGSRWYAATNKGLISCDINATDWVRELPLDEDRAAVALLKTSDGRLYTSISNEGIWTSDPSFQLSVIQHFDRYGTERWLRAQCNANELTITYSSPQAAETTIALYDLLGREVEVLADELIPAGETTITKPIASLPSGTYFVVATTPTGRQVCKVVK